MHIKHHLASRRQSGMSLIEVLVSLLIFSFGVLGMVALQAQATKFSTDAEDRMHAVYCGNEIVSMMWAQRTMSLPAATLTALTGTGGLCSGLTAGVAASTVDGVPIATVTITWTSPAKIGTSKYTTQVAMP